MGLMGRRAAILEGADRLNRKTDVEISRRYMVLLAKTSLDPIFSGTSTHRPVAHPPNRSSLAPLQSRRFSRKPGAFEIQKRRFARQATGIAGQGRAATHYPMARNDP